MNLQEQIGVLEAGVDQLIVAATVNASHTAEAASAEQSAADHADATGVTHAQADAVVDTAEQAGAVETEEAAETVVADAEATAQPDAVQPEPANVEATLEIARPAQNEITMTIGGRTVRLNPLQVGQLVEELANARASMQPEPPPGIPPGWQFVSTKNPVMAVQKQSSGDRLLVLRHTGHGWVPFTFSPDMVVQMYMMLTQR